MLICFLRLFEHDSLNQTDLGEYVFQYFLCQLVCMFLKKVDAIVFRGSSCERISKIVKTENAEIHARKPYLKCIKHAVKYGLLLMQRC